MLIMGSTARLSPAVYVCMLRKPAEARALLLPSPRSYGGPTAPPAHADKLECGPSSCLYPVGTSHLPGSTCWSLSFSTQTLCAPAALPSWEVLLHAVVSTVLPPPPASRSASLKGRVHSPPAPLSVLVDIEAGEGSSQGEETFPLPQLPPMDASLFLTFGI